MNATNHSYDWKEAALNAARTLQLVDDKAISETLLALADEIAIGSEKILKANAEDLAAMEKAYPMYDRLLLNEQRLQNIAADIRNVAGLPSPLGKTLMETVRPNGMKISKITVPFGVIGIVYEARPNVTFDVFSLCLKSGNSCVLKGGSDAYHSNAAIVSLIREVLNRFGLNPDIITLLPSGHEATADLLNATGYVDLVIPRGGKGLIDFVRTHSKIPVIETGAGICHTYFDEFGNTEKGSKIILNAKTRRVSVCNALDCLIIHEKRLSDLPALCKKLAEKNVVIYADAKAYTFLVGKYPVHLLQKATQESFGTEFLDYKMAIKTVESLQEAIQHINCYGSKHSECIVSENEANRCNDRCSLHLYQCFYRFYRWRSVRIGC